MASKAGTSLSRKREGVVELDVVEGPRIRSAESLSDPSLYVNRELSLLAFQRRVLEEAEDPTNPLLERVKFLSIVGSNLDEFFMVRVAGLMRQMEAGIGEPAPTAWTPHAQLVRHPPRGEASIIGGRHKCLPEDCTPALEEAGIQILEYGASQQAAADARRDSISPRPCSRCSRLWRSIPGRPFPHISNLSLNLAVLIRDAAGDERFARVKVPDPLPQLIPVDRKTKQTAASGKDQSLRLAGTGDRGQPAVRCSPAWRSSKRIRSM